MNSITRECIADCVELLIRRHACRGVIASADGDATEIDRYRAGEASALLQKLLASAAVHGDALTIEGGEWQTALSWVPAATPAILHGCAP